MHVHRYTHARHDPTPRRCSWLCLSGQVALMRDDVGQWNRKCTNQTNDLHGHFELVDIDLDLDLYLDLGVR